MTVTQPFTYRFERNQEEYVAQPTRGGAKNIVHAIFGLWEERSGQFVAKSDQCLEKAAQEVLLALTNTQISKLATVVKGIFSKCFLSDWRRATPSFSEQEGIKEAYRICGHDVAKFSYHPSVPLGYSAALMDPEYRLQMEEISILADVYNLTVMIVRKDGTISVINEGGEEFVPIYFDGVSHYERMIPSDEVYEMNTALVSCMRGTEYQLRYLLYQAIKNKHRNIPFSCWMEPKDMGIMDDVVTLQGDTLQVSQLKRYSQDFSETAFFTEGEYKPQHAKDKKLHIGKCFDGFLAWVDWNKKKKKAQKIKTYIVTNVTVQGPLKQALKNNDFSNHLKLLQNLKDAAFGYMESKAREDERTITLDFFAKEDILSTTESKRYCEKLKRTGHIVKNLKGRHELVRNTGLPDLFPDKHQDIVRVLQEKKQGNTRQRKFVNLKKDEKEKMFSTFLSSFHIRDKQPNETALVGKSEVFLLRNMNIPERTMYAHLHFRVCNWFIGERSVWFGKVLTEKDFEGYITSGQNITMIIEKLTQATDEVIRSIPQPICPINRTELKEIFRKKIIKNDLVAISGEKGSGKSTLVKEALVENGYCYLAFTAASMNGHETIHSFFNSMGVFQNQVITDPFPERKDKILYIDALEKVDRFDTVFGKLVPEFQSKGWRVVVTCTKHGYKRLKKFQESQNSAISLLKMPSLTEKEVNQAIKKKPALANFKQIGPLFYIPFYLNQCYRLTEHTLPPWEDPIDGVTKFRKMVWEELLLGKDETKTQKRKNFLYSLSQKIAKKKNLSECTMGYEEVLVDLCREGFLQMVGNDPRFTHDLFLQFILSEKFDEESSKWLKHDYSFITSLTNEEMELMAPYLREWANYGFQLTRQVYFYKLMMDIVDHLPEKITARDQSSLVYFSSILFEEVIMDGLWMEEFIKVRSEFAKIPKAGILEAPLIAVLNSNSWVNVLEILLKNGADPNEAGIHGDLPLHTAIDNQEDGCVRLLLSQPNINLTLLDNRGRSPLVCALESEREDYVELLANIGVDYEIEFLDAYEACDDSQLAMLKQYFGADPEEDIEPYM